MTIEKSAAFTLTVVSVPDFNLILPGSSGTAYAGQVFPILISIESVDAFAGDVVVSMTGQPAGSSVEFFPSNKITVAPAYPGNIQINIAIPADNSLVGLHAIVIMAVSTTYNGQ